MESLKKVKFKAYKSVNSHIEADARGTGLLLRWGTSITCSCNVQGEISETVAFVLDGTRVLTIYPNDIEFKNKEDIIDFEMFLKSNFEDLEDKEKEVITDYNMGLVAKFCDYIKLKSNYIVDINIFNNFFNI